MSESLDDDLEPSDYFVTETRTLMVTASSAAEARKTAELILRLTPENRVVTTTMKTEKVRN